MGSSRLAIGAIFLAVFGASSALLATPSCSTEGDVLVLLPRVDSAVTDVDPIDEGAADTAPVGEDVAELHCNNEVGSCRYPGEQCCLVEISMFCTTRGECDGGNVECSRSAHCAPGLRCCAQGAAFSITSSCRPGCAQYQLCASDGECADGGHCVDAALSGFAVCE